MSNVENDRKNHLGKAKKKFFETKQIASNIPHMTVQQQRQYVYQLPILVKSLIDILEDYLQPSRLGNQFNIDQMLQEINSSLPNNSSIVLDQHNIDMLNRIDRESLTILDNVNTIVEFNSIQEIINRVNSSRIIISQLNNQHEQIERYFQECLTSVRGAALGIFLVCDDAHQYYRNQLSINSIIVGVRAFINAINNLLNRVDLESI
jgi:hypothetical protein